MRFHLTRRIRWPVIFLTVFSAAVLLVLAFYKSGQSPYEYLRENNNDCMTTPSELLYQETTESDMSVVFYTDQCGKYRCALLRKGWFGYQIIGYSGVLSRDNTGTYLRSAFVRGQKKYGICWGVLLNNDISEVFLDDEPCSIANTQYYKFRIFWRMGLWDEDPVLRMV